MYTFCGILNKNVTHRVCDFQIELLSMPIHLKIITLGLKWQFWHNCRYLKSFTRSRLSNMNGLVSWFVSCRDELKGPLIFAESGACPSYFCKDGAPDCVWMPGATAFLLKKCLLPYWEFLDMPLSCKGVYLYFCLFVCLFVFFLWIVSKWHMFDFKPVA